MVNFSIAVSALRTAFTRQDVTANNVANVLSPAFQARRAHQANTATGSVEVDAVTRSEAQGVPDPTGRALDLAVSGQGYLAVDTAKGPRYTRIGSFGVDATGRLADGNGNLLSPGMTLPPDAVAIEVSNAGVVQATMPDGSRRQLGQIELHRFANNAGLEAIGGGLFSPTPASGPAMTGLPLTGGYGEIVSGFIESSNVDLGTEMTDMIRNRTTAGISAATIRAQDKMLGELLDLKG